MVSEEKLLPGRGFWCAKEIGAAGGKLLVELAAFAMDLKESGDLFGIDSAAAHALVKLTLIELTVAGGANAVEDAAGGVGDMTIQPFQKYLFDCQGQANEDEAGRAGTGLRRGIENGGDV